MSPALEHILKQTYEATDLHRRVRLLQSILETVLYDEPRQLRLLSPEKKRARAMKEIVGVGDIHVFETMDEHVWGEFTAGSIASKMKKLLTESEALPVMTLYTPVEFSDKQLAPISVWVRQEVAPGMLFETEVDPKVVGGCAFVYKDTHYDWSLRRYLRAKRGLVTTLMNSYGHPESTEAKTESQT